MKRRLCLHAAVGVAVGVVLLAGSGGSVHAATCTLVPTLQSSTVTQGLNSYSALARGKETLVRLYLSLPSCAASTSSIRLNSAQLTVTVKDAANGGVQSTKTLPPTAPIPDASNNYPQITNLTALTAVAPSDPMFVIPGSILAPPGDTNRLTVTVTATIGYQALSPPGSAATVALPTSRQPAITKTVEKRTNALRILAVPFANQLDASSNANLQNALATISRLFPVQDGTVDTGTPGARVGALNGIAGGLRYAINAGPLNLAALNIPLPFCGTTGNFGTSSTDTTKIRGQLAQFLNSWNAANDADHKADKVLGVINEASTDSTSSASNPACYEGMASLVSPEAWVRATSFAGGIAAMELMHTFGAVPFARSDGGYHSPNVQADTAAGDVNKAYNVTDRAYLSDDRTTMYYSPPGFGNANALIEPLDWSFVLCKLGGATNSECTTSGVAGTIVGQNAGAPPPAFNLVGLTNGTTFNLVESFVASVPKTQPGDPTSPYTIQQFDANDHLLGTATKVNLSLTDTHHGGENNIDGATSDTNGLGLIAASVPLHRNAALQVDTKTVKLFNGTTPIYSATQTGTPSVTGATATLGSTGSEIKPGATKSLTHPIPTAAAYPQNGDYYFLADTTGSMDTAIGNVKSNISSIIDGIPTGTNPRFGAGNYRDFPVSETQWGFQNNAAIVATPPVSDPNGAQAAKDAVGAWLTGGGGDRPEAGLYALDQIASPDTFFRSNSNKVVVWFGDNPSHEPICSGVWGGSYDITRNSVLTKLQAKSVKVMAVSVNSGGTSVGLDGDPNDAFSYGAACNSTGGPGQGTAIATGTGGVFKSNVAPTEVSAAIIDALKTRYTLAVESWNCSNAGLSLTFDPSSTTVTSGETANIGETVHVTESTPSGVYSCTVHFTRNGVADPSLDQTIPVDVTGFTGPHALLTWTSDDLVNNRYDVALKCNATLNILAVALKSPVYDTNQTCPGGGGSYVVIPNDGFGQGDPANPAATVVTPLTSSPLGPTAAIASPANASTVGEHQLVTLRGSGYDNKTQAPIPANPASNLQWFDGATAVGTGPNVDLSGLAPGTHVIKLVVTDSTGATDEKTVTVTSLTDSDGDLLTVDQEASIDCGGSGGDSDPTNGSRDADGDGILNRDDPAPCTPSPIQGQGLFARNPFKLSGTDNFSLSAIIVPGVDLGLALSSSVKLAQVAGKPILPGPIPNSGWVALNQVGAAVFSHSAAAAALAPFVGHTVRLKLVGSGPGYSFEVYFDVTVAP